MTRIQGTEVMSGRSTSPADPCVMPSVEKKISRRSFLDNISNRTIFKRMLIVIGIIVIWEVLPILLHTKSILFPNFAQVMTSLFANIGNGALISATGNSLEVLLIGLAVGVGAAFILVFVAVMGSFGREGVGTLTAALNPLPSIGLLPIALLWFGFSTTAVVFVIAFSTVWPMGIAVLGGIDEIPKTWIRLAGSLDQKGINLFRRILLPASLPGVISGLRISWAYGWRTLIAAELVYGASGSSGGLGYFIYNARYQLNSPATFAGLLVIMIVGLLVEYGIFAQIERVTVYRWAGK